MQFFDFVPQDFFKPLTGINRCQYMDIITLLWERCRRSPLYGESKTLVFDWIEDYFSGLQDDVSLEEDEQLTLMEDVELEGPSPRNLAALFLRRLKTTGWLEERVGGYEEEPSIVINHHIVPIIRAFGDVVAPQITAYKGKLFKIYKLLLSIAESDSPYESILMEASNDLDALNAALRQLAASIEEHMDELTRGKTPEEILSLFDSYEEKVVIGAYHRFKTNDNLFYYRSELFESLTLCRTQYLEALIKDCSSIAQISEEAANTAVLRLVAKLEEDLREMGEIMRIIDERHILYRSRAVQRAQFLLLSDGTVKSKISRILQYYAETTDSIEGLADYTDDFTAKIFQFYPQGYFDDRSLKPPVLSRSPTPIEELGALEVLDPEVLAQKQEQLHRFIRNAVTVENVNRFARTVLRRHQATTAAALVDSHPSVEDLVKIIGLHTYSTSVDRSYEIDLKPNTVICRGLRFQDFTLRRR